jgi:hypothetical protein
MKLIRNETLLELLSPLRLKGDITLASHFPTSATVQDGWTYLIKANVTDNDATKTNTGQSFLSGSEISWNGTNWSILGVEQASGLLYSNLISGLTATNVQSAIDEVVGDIAIVESHCSSQNKIVVDANITEMAGKFYKTWADADAWITANTTPASDNLWEIEIHGNNSENIIVREWVTISGEDTTYLTGVITSAGLDITFEGSYKLLNCTITNLEIGADRSLLLKNCNIKGGTCSCLYAIFDMCYFWGGTFSSSFFIFLFRSAVLGGTFSKGIDALASYFSNCSLEKGRYSSCQMGNNISYDIVDASITFNNSLFTSEIDMSSCEGAINLHLYNCPFSSGAGISLKSGVTLYSKGNFYGITINLNGAIWVDYDKLCSTNRITHTSSPYTLLGSDEVLFVDTDGGAVTVNLPAGVEGRHFKIINVGSSGNNITVTPNGAEKIFASASETLSDAEVIDIHFNGTEGWW